MFPTLSASTFAPCPLVGVALKAKSHPQLPPLTTSCISHQFPGRPPGRAPPRAESHTTGNSLKRPAVNRVTLPVGRCLGWRPFQAGISAHTVFDDMKDLLCSDVVCSAVKPNILIENFRRQPYAGSGKFFSPRNPFSSERVCILSLHRAQNLMIVSRKMLVQPLTLVRNILELDLSISRSELDTFAMFMPDAEEARKFELYIRNGGVLDRLREVDRYVAELLPQKIPTLQLAVKILLVRHDFEIRKDSIMQNLRSSLRGCASAYANRGLKRLLAACLRLGNYVQYARGPSDSLETTGFYLESLRALSEFKTVWAGGSLLHYALVSMILDAEPEDALSLLELQDHIAAASKESKGFIEQALKTVRDEISECVSSFIQTSKSIIQATNSLSDVQRHHEVLARSYAVLGPKSWVENSADPAFSNFIRVITEMSNLFKTEQNGLIANYMGLVETYKDVRRVIMFVGRYFGVSEAFNDARQENQLELYLNVKFREKQNSDHTDYRQHYRFDFNFLFGPIQDVITLLISILRDQGIIKHLVPLAASCNAISDISISPPESSPTSSQQKTLELQLLEEIQVADESKIGELLCKYSAPRNSRADQERIQLLYLFRRRLLSAAFTNGHSPRTGSLPNMLIANSRNERIPSSTQQTLGVIQEDVTDFVPYCNGNKTRYIRSAASERMPPAPLEFLLAHTSRGHPIHGRNSRGLRSLSRCSRSPSSVPSSIKRLIINGRAGELVQDSQSTNFQNIHNPPPAALAIKLNNHKQRNFGRKAITGPFTLHCPSPLLSIHLSAANSYPETLRLPMFENISRPLSSYILGHSDISTESAILMPQRLSRITKIHARPLVQGKADNVKVFNAFSSMLTSAFQQSPLIGPLRRLEEEKNVHSHFHHSRVPLPILELKGPIGRTNVRNWTPTPCDGALVIGGSGRALPSRLVRSQRALRAPDTREKHENRMLEPCKSMGGSSDKTEGTVSNPHIIRLCRFTVAITFAPFVWLGLLLLVFYSCPSQVVEPLYLQSCFLRWFIFQLLGIVPRCIHHCANSTRLHLPPSLDAGNSSLVAIQAVNFRLCKCIDHLLETVR